MKTSDLKKNHNTSVRVNKRLLKALKAQDMSLQQFLDKCLDSHFGDIKIQIPPEKKLD